MRPLLLMQAYIGANAARLEAASLLPSISRGGGPAQLVEGLRGAAQRPLRQSFGLPPPPENRGRKKKGRPIAGPPLPFSPLEKAISISPTGGRSRSGRACCRSTGRCC